jgi:hypothetical protein
MRPKRDEPRIVVGAVKAAETHEPITRIALEAIELAAGPRRGRW